MKFPMKSLVWTAMSLAASVANADLIERTVTLSYPAEKPKQPSVIWKGIDLETGQVVDEPKQDAPSWDIAFRQAWALTNGTTGVAKIETKEFEKVKSAPVDVQSYSVDREYDPDGWGPAPSGRYNPALMDWFEYHMMQKHLVGPRPLVFVVKTRGGHHVKLQFVDYVKNGWALRPQGRKLVATKVGAEDNQVHLTLRYKYNTEAGSTRLE